jgi:hypothetical protein
VEEALGVLLRRCGVCLDCHPGNADTESAVLLGGQEGWGRSQIGVCPGPTGAEGGGSRGMTSEEKQVAGGRVALAFPNRGSAPRLYRGGETLPAPEESPVSSGAECGKCSQGARVDS